MVFYIKKFFRNLIITITVWIFFTLIGIVLFLTFFKGGNCYIRRYTYGASEEVYKCCPSGNILVNILLKLETRGVCSKEMGPNLEWYNCCDLHPIEY